MDQSIRGTTFASGSSFAWEKPPSGNCVAMSMTRFWALRSACCIPSGFPYSGRTFCADCFLVAAADADSPLPRVLAEEVAAELALALEWEEQNQLARQRKADLELSFPGAHPARGKHGA